MFRRREQLMMSTVGHGASAGRSRRGIVTVNTTGTGAALEREREGGSGKVRGGALIPSYGLS